MFESADCLRAKVTEHGYWLGYASEGDFRAVPRQLGTGFDLNVIGDVCYLLDVRLDDRYRGKWYGSGLYVALRAIAGDLGCCEIRQTPSGTTFRGESRRAWLMRRGWDPDGISVYRACLREEPTIVLTPAEIQSQFNRVQWAEQLIVQLPPAHEGRTSWLLNFGVGPEAHEIRARKAQEIGSE